MQCETMLYVKLTQTQQMVYYNHISCPVTTIILSQYLRILQYKQNFICKTLFIFSLEIQDGSQEPVYINKTILFLKNSRWWPGTHLYKQNYSFSQKFNMSAWDLFVYKTLLFLENSRWQLGTCLYKQN